MAQATTPNTQELSYFEKIELIRKYWQFAAICQFFLTFQKAYNFSEPFETERLEQALAACDKSFLESILLNLMKNLPGQRFIHLPVLEIQIKKECEKREFNHPFCDENHPGFFSLQISDQIKLIHALTEWQMEDFERVRSKVDEEDDCDEWRIESIGRDKKYNTYWLFDDNRLYKQKYQAPKKSKSVKKSKKNNGQEQVSSVPTDWELVCSTVQEWEEFPSQFDNSRNLDEQYLKDFLIEHVLPKVLPAIKSKERQKKKEEQIMTFQPKRSSRLQAKELHRKEQEEEQRKIELLEAMEAREKDFKDTKSEAIIQNVPNLNTREMRAKRRALLNEGRLEEVLELERDGVLRSVFSDSEYKSRSKSKRGSEESSVQEMKEDEELENMENGNHDDGEESEEDWYFKCVCGAEGQNRDDGLMMIACERCGIWQHVQCQDFYADNSQNADLSSIFFLCQECLMNKPAAATLATNLSTQLDDSSERTTPSNRTDITRESSQSVAQTLGYPLAALNINGTDPNSPMSLDIKSTSSNPE